MRLKHRFKFMERFNAIGQFISMALIVRLG
jgi:hypothetical protein